MDLYYKQEVSVGLLVMVAVAGFFVGLMWLTGRSFRTSNVAVTTQFLDVGTLTVGDPVRISGVRIGRVAGTALEDAGRVLVTLEVTERFRPRVDAKVSIKSLDFLGAKYIDYDPGSSATYLEDGQMIVGTTSGDIADAAAGLTDEAADVLIGAQRLLTEQMANEVQQTLAAAQRALNAVSQVGESQLADNAQASLLALKQVASRLDSTLANPAIEESLSQLDELTENVTEMAEGLAGATMALSAMLQQVSDTSGTIGKLLTDQTIHTDLHELLGSLTQLLDDVRERPGRYTFVSVF
jgi:phospholipid/cholesterol/gamma-HCH transport system substrate-binding protein